MAFKDISSWFIQSYATCWANGEWLNNWANVGLCTFETETAFMNSWLYHCSFKQPKWYLNWSASSYLIFMIFFTEPQFEAKKVVLRQNSLWRFTRFFPVPIGNYYTWLILFTQQAVVMVLTNIRYSIVRRRSSCQGATRELVRRRKERIEIVRRQVYKLRQQLSIHSSKNAPTIGLQRNDHWLLHFWWDCEWPLISSFTQEGKVGGLPYKNLIFMGFAPPVGGTRPKQSPWRLSLQNFCQVAHPLLGSCWVSQ